jgi:hypothetical protein
METHHWVNCCSRFCRCCCVVLTEEAVHICGSSTAHQLQGFWIHWSFPSSISAPAVRSPIWEVKKVKLALCLISLCHEDSGEWRYKVHHSWPRHYMGVSSQLQAPTTLPIVLEAGWAPEPDRMMWRREKSCTAQNQGACDSIVGWGTILQAGHGFNSWWGHWIFQLT